MQIELLTDLVGHLAASVRSRGGRLLVAFSGESRYYDVQAALLKELEIPTLDLSTQVLMNAAGIPSREIYFIHHGHWRPAAHRVAAQLLRAELEVLLAPESESLKP